MEDLTSFVQDNALLLWLLGGTLTAIFFHVRRLRILRRERRSWDQHYARLHREADQVLLRQGIDLPDNGSLSANSMFWVHSILHIVL